ncbi:MAG: LysR family transcriptional regulator [Myxococcaceae bacterium]|nr:LysR family transcriptional regulator [Myxococcaceae bacterium]
MVLPDLESLRCFEAGASRLNFRAASKQVALSPAAFSDRIRRLEEQVGTPLFTRSTRRVALTEAGHALWPRAREALEAARLCLSPAAPDTTPYALTVSTRFELGLSWLLPALKVLEVKVPHRTLHLHFADSPEMLQALRNGLVDCAISSVRIAESNIRYATLHEEDYALVASPALLKAHPLREPEDAAALRLLDISGDLPLFRYFLDARPPGERWLFESVQYLGTITAVRHRALEGDGVAVLPRYFVRSQVKAGELKVLFPSLALRTDAFRLIWRAGHPREAQLEALGAELRALPIR